MKKRVLNWILATALFVIWGNIADELVNAVSQDDDLEGDNSETHENQSQRAFYVFKEMPRDPFVRPQKPRLHPPQANQSKEVAWAPPPFKLVGIVAGGNRNTAIMEAASGETVFVGEGESVGGMKLLRIEKHRVTYLYDKRKADWVFEPGDL